MSLILAAAMVLDALAGEPRWLWSRLPHPAVLMGRAVGVLDARLNHPSGGRLAGILAVAILVIGAGLLGWALSHLGWLVALLGAAILLAHKSLLDHVRAVADGLRMSLPEGRRAVSLIVSRDMAQSDEPAVSRAAIESLAENFSDGVIAPAFWFAVAGLPGILIYKVVNTADSMIGYRTEKYATFGWAAARLDDVLNWIPARLTAVLIALVGGALRTWPQIRADARLHRSPNAGWPEAAMARALHIALAGPRSYHGTVQDLAWVNGSGKRDLGPVDIDAAIGILWKAWALALGAVVLMGVLF